MQPERRDRLYLEDIVEAGRAIARFLTTTDLVRFSADEVVQSAFLHKLTVIGEAAARLTPELKARHADMPWADIVAFRNIVVHAYFSIDLAIVWTAVTSDVPMLVRQVEQILAAEFSPGSGE